MGYTKDNASIAGQCQTDYPTAFVNYANIGDKSNYNINGITWGMAPTSAINTMKNTGWKLIDRTYKGEKRQGIIGTYTAPYNIYWYRKNDYEIVIYDDEDKVIDISIIYYDGELMAL